VSRRSSSDCTAPHLGGARISTTQWGAVQQRATPGTTRPALSAGLLAGLLSLFFAAALAAAAPASADDSVRPAARVTHGPSCRPGGLVVEVTGGTAPYSVRLATTRTPAGEDEAVVQPGKTVELRSDDVDWGETIDGRLEYSARDGSGDTYVDELEEYSFTRPTKEDCEAVAAPTDPHPTTSAPESSSTPSSSASSASDTPATSAPSTSAASAPSPAGSDGGDDAAKPAPQEVVAGGTVTLQAGGFLPGERVTIAFEGSDDVLATTVAGDDGTVRADVRIPAETEAGPVSVALVGADSAVVAAVELQVAAAGSAVAADDGGQAAGDLVPLTAAAAALVMTMGALVSVAGRQRSGDRPLRRA
jgi:hypothetical protein